MIGMYEESSEASEIDLLRTQEEIFFSNLRVCMVLES